MVIRFGAVPSVPSDPQQLILDSLESANCGWSVERVVPAGTAESGKRQSLQFGFVRSRALRE
jgi:hypothetical protein